MLTQEIDIVINYVEIVYLLIQLLTNLKTIKSFPWSMSHAKWKFKRISF